jgi:hypothetical protein
VESTLARTNPALFARVQALAEPAIVPADETPLSLEKLLEPSPSAASPEPVALAAASTALAIPYSHAAMVELMVEHPTWSHKQFAAHWGKGAGWFASVLASDAFQLELDKRRGEIPNPELTATMDERFRALALRSLDVLQDKLGGKEVSDNIVLRATEIGVKALGMGQAVAPPAAPSGNVDTLAERLVAAFEKQQKNARKPAAIEAEVVVVTEEEGETK